MRRSTTGFRKWLLALVLVSLGVMVQADTTVLDIELGDSFTGTIDVAGVDTVEAHFFAAQGTSVTLKVQATQGSSLEPTAAVTDASGTPLDLGPAQTIAWLPVANLRYHFTIPDTGLYVAEIGGSSGSGGFWAILSGSSSGASMTSVSGTVTDLLTGDPIEGVSVRIGSTPLTVTDASGDYSAELPAGNYLVTFEADGFEPVTEPLDVSAGTPAVLNISLTPLVPVVIDVSVTGDEIPGGAVTATADVVVPPGGTIDSIVWTQKSGVAADILVGAMNTATITLGPEAEYNAELIHVLMEPPVTADQLPENVPLPPGEFPGGLQDRLQVVGINPFALEEAGLVVLEVEVHTSEGIFTEEVEIHASLPWKVTTGLRDVPSAVPVLLQAKEQAAYFWNLMPPSGSGATLTGATTRNPYFTPDMPGLYTLTVSETMGGPVSTLEVFAGTWRGVIVDQDNDGRPVPDTACTFCHNDVNAPDKFTSWTETGHAEIFTDNLDTSTHYSSSCFPCHSVGYDTGAGNDGFDEAPDYQNFLDAGLLNHPGDNWTTVLEQYPETARLANIQCENCHGPQDSVSHGVFQPFGDPRVSLSADVCGSCHGEPLRHARFQQWQLSGHANYELAIDEGDSGSCARCHTGNGFLDWLPILLDEDPDTDPAASIFICGNANTCIGGPKNGESCASNGDCPSWETDEVHPQTCATCHDPHAIGTTTGVGTNATVRISGDTPPLIAGFTATDVGRGAICMTCHNSRRGLYNDGVFDSLSLSDRSRAPHGSAQADVLMGENAFFVEVNDRGGHSFVDDACVGCHMEATPPPDILSYNLGGTNHTFYASPEICSECHSPHLQASDIQNGVQHLLDQVAGLMESEVLALMDDLTGLGYSICFRSGSSCTATITSVDEVESLELGESRGRQAFTVTLVVGGAIGTFGANSIDVLDGGGAVLDELYAFADDAVPKAGWNWSLFNNDGSVGVHNPYFATGALAAARDALVAIPHGMGAMQPAIRSGRQALPHRDGPRDARPPRRHLD